MHVLWFSCEYWSRRLESGISAGEPDVTSVRVPIGSGDLNSACAPLAIRRSVPPRSPYRLHHASPPTMSNYRRVSVIHRPLSQNTAVQGVVNALAKPSVWRLSPMHWAILASFLLSPAGRIPANTPVQVGEPGTGRRFELCIRNGVMTGYTESHALDGGQYFSVHPDNLGGHTWATDEDIRNEGKPPREPPNQYANLPARRIIKKHPLYNQGTSDCQNFVVDLLNRILENKESRELRKQTRSRGLNRFMTAAITATAVGVAGYVVGKEYSERHHDHHGYDHDYDRRY